MCEKIVFILCDGIILLVIAYGIPIWSLTVLYLPQWKLDFKNIL